MSDRIQKLRNQSQTAQPTLSLERAKLLTDFYQSGMAEKVSVPVARALAFTHLLKNKEICINEGELIVGERGPAPKVTPTFPEICTHTLEDLKVLNSREKISFTVSKEVMKESEETIIPFWNGRSIRDKIFQAMDPEWIAAYNAGIFTEFMEQRAPGHTVADNKIFQMGFLDFKKKIQESLDQLDFYEDPEAFDKREELKAMNLVADAIILYAKRHVEKLRELAEIEENAPRKRELEHLAEICEHIPANPPKTFHEALQHYWFIHLGVITELNTWDSFNPGRLDQHLYPFYKKGLAEGTLTKEQAKELLKSFWVKFNNQPAPPKVGVTAEESNTYTDFCLINLGGVTEEGHNAVNELSYLILDVIEEMRILQPSSMVQISCKTPDRFLKRALKIVKTGFGQPSIFNTDELIQEMLRTGKNIEDARNGGSSGCVETGAFGKENYILTGYFNLPKVLEVTLNNGIDPRTGIKIGLTTGDPRDFHSFEELFNAFKQQLRYFIDIKIKGNNIIERLWAEYLPAPFLSIIIDDCIKNGKDYNNGGARYNSSYIQGVGIGSITDSLTAIKYNIFDNNLCNMDELLESLKDNFEGKETLRQKLVYETPKYGNDDDYADNILKRIFENYFKMIDGRPNTKGGKYRINLLPTTVHVYFGSVIGALPDGRKAYEPLSEGISPVQGADTNGPTAVFKSAAKIDHVKTGGTLLNQKYNPDFLKTEEGLEKLGHLIRAYFKLGGHHVQFNIVTKEMLLKAQKNPEKYRDLIVRVAGYSDYFINLNKKLQDEIISRTEHNSL
ncbi:MAG: formate C-acetyltransferase/glycerol dehydratase family glycyl radical enzyme [Candidatus Heimdallarchaeota archaeon]|nr:formate C-acetyltransferase/glycerol dehydratase family glycyl radical enzyme [Candidatus Heimdallarchaeota archaeon]